MNQELLTDLELLNKFKQVNFHKLDSFSSDFFEEYSDSIETRHLNLMEDLYKKIKNAPVPNLSRFGEKQFYHREFYFGDEDFFSLYWDTELATEIIKRDKLKPKTVPVNYLLDGLTQLNPLKVQACMKLTKVNPIFIVGVQPTKSGNHTLSKFRYYKSVFSIKKAYVVRFLKILFFVNFFNFLFSSKSLSGCENEAMR